MGSLSVSTQEFVPNKLLILGNFINTNILPRDDHFQDCGIDFIS